MAEPNPQRDTVCRIACRVARDALRQQLRLGKRAEDTLKRPRFTARDAVALVDGLRMESHKAFR